MANNDVERTHQFQLIQTIRSIYIHESDECSSAGHDEAIKKLVL